jgi:hypothetical protein
MKVLIGCRCSIDHEHVKETEALEIGTPAVIAVDCSRGLAGLASGKIHDELVRAMKVMADCSTGFYGDRTLMVKTEPASEWTTLTGDAINRGIDNIARRLEATNVGGLYITVPRCPNVEIYKIEEV